MPLNTSFLFSTVFPAPLNSPLQTPSLSPVWLQPERTIKLEISGVLILIIWYPQSCVVWGNSFQELYVKLDSFFFVFVVPRDILPVYISNLEDDRKNTKKWVKQKDKQNGKDKQKGKALSLPLLFFQLLPWECPRACWVHVLGFWPWSLPEV